MAKLNLMLFGLTVWLIPACLGKSSFTPFREQLKVLERELQKMRALIPDTEPSSIKQELSKSTGLANTLPVLVQKSVTETLGEMLQDKSIEGIISERVRGEIRSLKSMVHHLKGLVRSLTQRVTQAETEREIIRKNLDKQRKEFSERVNTLEKSLNMSREAFMNAKTYMDVNKTVCAGYEPKADKHMTRVTQGAHVSSVTVTTPSFKPPVAPDETARILVVPFSEAETPVNQIHLKNISVQRYPFIVLREVVSVVYVSREKTIYTSSRNPKRIVSYRLDQPGMSTVQNNMASSGMTDDGKQYVYFTTFYPRYTVSRMTRGRGVRRVVDLTNCGGYPHSIAVVGPMIYVACDTKLVEMNNYGKVFRDVNIGSHIYAVSLDPDKRVLYFNSDTQVIKMPVLHHRVTRAIAFYPNRTMALRVNSPPHIQKKTAIYFTEVFELTYIPRNFIAYKNRIYIGSQLGGHVDVLYWDGFESDTVLYELQRLQTATVNIALIPSDRGYSKDGRVITSRRLNLRSIKKKQD